MTLERSDAINALLPHLGALAEACDLPIDYDNQEGVAPIHLEVIVYDRLASLMERYPVVSPSVAQVLGDIRDDAQGVTDDQTARRVLTDTQRQLAHLADDPTARYARETAAMTLALARQATLATQPQAARRPRHRT